MHVRQLLPGPGRRARDPRRRDLGIEAAIWTLSNDAVLDLVRAADHPEAEAIVFSCTTVPTYDAVAARDAHAAFTAVISRHGLTKESRIGYSIGIGYPPDWGERTISLRADEPPRWPPACPST